MTKEPSLVCVASMQRLCGKLRSKRARCLHIASGILNPYTDTPACEYFERTKSASRR